MAEKSRNGADVIVESLKNHQVEYVFGIPGAKIDGLFNALVDDGPELIVTRHEQNAAFMAAAVGRLTGNPGVVIATSGPGASNLTTGLVTATSEGDPVLAIGGQVKRRDLLKLTHQSMNNAALFEPITKYSAEIQDPETISEVLANAYRLAKASKKGASFISIPQDVVDGPVESVGIKPLSDPKIGSASAQDIEYLSKKIQAAELPVFLVGMRASTEKEANAIRKIVEKTNIPVVETFQAAGVISRELENHFFGRVGLFRNQPGDMLLKRSDLVIAVGYDPIEYEARNWNAEGDSAIVVIDDTPAEIDYYFQPDRELIGDIAETLTVLLSSIEAKKLSEETTHDLESLHEKLIKGDTVKEHSANGLIHPLEVIETLQSLVTDEMTVTVDVGSHYIWMARHFRSYEPRHLLFSNGMQTLGVALPWAISAALVRPNTQIISISGDGGFLFSAQDLETAVRKKLKIIHLVWNDGRYNMVEFQEQLKYHRSSGVDFGPVDFVKYAEAFGAKGLRATNAKELEAAILTGIKTQGPVVIDIPIDYRDNETLGETILPDQFY
ncbi:acetolactate synthase, catabolic [Enterococcus moraviensis ATCC BAA-383]|uniref:Acetolactate synthase, catabolic n=1 Tax=Enterococcus moraviensis ATCC BAA-383 TaxID=1158609 RepID=R2QZ81_9ENTE|nr:acetolactate synthase AlsS [Enterococcus moraviensis]EOI01855.1 acetolactate synthase, catabolic [Enterococcus moraviensis ATCC BAA-383]EOT73610.1 acetolactate synthase, catabolic [Enterococcus moraviensis ATCC BAA-383]OJG69170.1 acetolactate synthase, catabolic [Enterococcus moraviensis]